MREIRIRDRNRAFRMIYLANLAEAVYVLNAFQKKTQRTPRREIALAAERLRAAQSSDCGLASAYPSGSILIRTRESLGTPHRRRQGERPESSPGQASRSYKCIGSNSRSTRMKQEPRSIGG